MRVEITRSFQWAEDGNHVRTVAVGEVLEGRGASVALDMKCGRPLADVVRLPLVEEYVAAGYQAENYAEMIAAETARAKADGKTVEVRLPTFADVPAGVSREEFDERMRLIDQARQKLVADRVEAERQAAEAAAQKAAVQQADKTAAERMAAAKPAEAEPEVPAPAPTPTPAAAPASSKRRGR